MAMAELNGSAAPAPKFCTVNPCELIQCGWAKLFTQVPALDRLPRTPGRFIEERDVDGPQQGAVQRQRQAVALVLQNDRQNFDMSVQRGREVLENGFIEDKGLDLIVGEGLQASRRRWVEVRLDVAGVEVLCAGGVGHGANVEFRQILRTADHRFEMAHGHQRGNGRRQTGDDDDPGQRADERDEASAQRARRETI